MNEFEAKFYRRLSTPIHEILHIDGTVMKDLHRVQRESTRSENNFFVSFIMRGSRANVDLIIENR